MRLILIDDEKALCAFLGELLESELGIEVLCLNSWVDYEYQEGDMAVSDMNGVDIEHADKRVPLILMTGDLFSERADLHKPFDIEELVALVRSKVPST